MRILMLILLAVATPAIADMRCLTRLVDRGDTPFEVLERCGPPVWEYSFIDWRQPGYAVYVDEWMYEFGTNRFRRLLSFENGRLVRVDERDKPLRTGGLE
jgi:hypothetical protein